MFLSLRDIRFAKGRFALMTGVIALVTLLIVLLSALTRGLGNQSTSAVTQLPASQVLLAPSGATTTWSDSVITPAQVASAAQGTAAAERAEALGIARARLTTGDQTTSVAVFGMAPGGRVAARLATSLADDEVVLPREVTGVAVGQHIELNGHSVLVKGFQDTQWYSHSPVAWTTLATQNVIGHTPAGQATALLHEGSSADAGTLAKRLGLTAVSGSGIVNALPGYSSEHGSLLMIQAFLYGICALVVLAFLSVWTLQRTRDIAVLRALGASRGHVLRDSLGQAALLLVGGSVVGGIVGSAIALAVRQMVPVEVLAATTLLPTAGVALVGLAGSVLATRKVTTIDPMIALGGN